MSGPRVKQSGSKPDIAVVADGVMSDRNGDNPHRGRILPVVAVRCCCVSVQCHRSSGLTMWPEGSMSRIELRCAASALRSERSRRGFLIEMRRVRPRARP